MTITSAKLEEGNKALFIFSVIIKLLFSVIIFRYIVDQKRILIILYQGGTLKSFNKDYSFPLIASG